MSMSNTTKEVELLPCPFCGGEAVLSNVRMSDLEFRIGCYNEHCWRPGTDYYSCKETIIGLWNRRAYDTLRAENTALRAACEAALSELQTGYVVHTDGQFGSVEDFPVVKKLREALKGTE